MKPLEEALNSALENWQVTTDERDDLAKALAEHKAQAAKEAELDILRREAEREKIGALRSVTVCNGG